MRIVHFLTRVRTEDGGVARATLDLCGALASAGHDVTLVTFEARDVPDAWKNGEPGCPRVEELPPINGPIKLFSRWARRRLEMILSRADVAHIQELWLPPAAQVAQVARRVGTPYILSVHGMLDDWAMAQKSFKKQAYLKLVGNRMIRGARVVHCAAAGEARQAQRWLPQQLADIVPLLLDIEPYRILPSRGTSRAGLPGDAGAPTVAFLGRVHPQKGIDRLIEAAGALARAGEATEVLIAGTGAPEYLDELKQLAASLGIADRVHFLGHVLGADKVRLLRGADMLVLPSFQESFGLVLVEALACGTPVITTRAVDISPELETSGSSIIIETPTPAAVGGAISQLLRDPARRIDMGEAGRRWVLEYLDRDRVLAQFDGLYRKAAGMEAERAPRGELSGALAV